MGKYIILLLLLPNMTFAQLTEKKWMVTSRLGIYNSKSENGSTHSSKSIDYGLAGGIIIGEKLSLGLSFENERSHSDWQSQDYYSDRKNVNYNYGIYGKYFGSLSNKVFYYGALSILKSNGKSEYDYSGTYSGPDFNYSSNGMKVAFEPGILFLTKSGFGIEVSFPLINYSKEEQDFDDPQKEDENRKEFRFNFLPEIITVSFSFYFY